MGDASSSGVYYYTIVGDIKFVDIVTDSTVAEADTIDLGSDSAGGKINTIHGAVARSVTNAERNISFVQSTGILTLGASTSGVTNILCWGL